MSYIVPLDECGPDCVALVGGKAAGLGRLLQHRFQVPPGFAVTTDAYHDFLTASGLGPEIGRTLTSAEDVATQHQASERIRGLFEQAKPVEAISAEIATAYGRLSSAGMIPVAVRSSATHEDTAEASFAGQQETFLWIQSPEAVARSVLRCWGSLFTPQAISYRAHLGMPVEAVAMGVVVQAMVSAEVAGVMITVDPLTGDPSQITIEASYGLGIAVVGGEVTPDRFDVDKVTLEIRSRRVGAKQVAYRFDQQTGEVRLCDVPAEEQSKASLSDEEVIEVAALGKRIERALDSAQDIEWAIGRGSSAARELFTLQTRPETVWSKKRRDPIAPPGTTAIERVLASMMKRRT